MEKLNDFIDESDPDVDVPNIVHAFQTAERIREHHPDLDWLHLTGLIHDLGKVIIFFLIKILVEIYCIDMGFVHLDNIGNTIKINNTVQIIWRFCVWFA